MMYFRAVGVGLHKLNVDVFIPYVQIIGVIFISCKQVVRGGSKQ